MLNNMRKIIAILIGLMLATQARTQSFFTDDHKYFCQTKADGTLELHPNDGSISKGEIIVLSSINKSYSSTSTSTTNHSSTSRCKECHDSKRCKHCNGGYTKYTGNQSLNGFVGAPVCGFCYGTGICQKCATNKASSSMLCGKCKGNRYCMTCNGTGKVNYGKEKCPICKGEKVCQTCKGSGKR